MNLPIVQLQQSQSWVEDIDIESTLKLGRYYVGGSYLRRRKTHHSLYRGTLYPTGALVPDGNKQGLDYFRRPGVLSELNVPHTNMGSVVSDWPVSFVLLTKRISR